MMLLERMREKGIGTLMFASGAPLDRCWQLCGEPNEAFSMSDVRKAIESGDLIRVDAKTVKVSPHILDAEKKAKRKSAGQKAAQTRRNAPLSYYARQMLGEMKTYTEVRPETYHELEGLRECFRKGFCMKLTWDSPSGRYDTYRWTGREEAQ